MGRFGALHRQRFDVAAEVRKFDADIVVVPESWREHDGRGVLDDLSGDGYQIETHELATLTVSGFRPRYEKPGEGRLEIAICSRFPVRSRRELPIGRVGGDPYGARSALSCTIDIEGTDVDVVAVHTSSLLWKLGPVRHLRALRPLLPTRDRVAIVAGDCNLWGPGVVAILPDWRRAVLGRTYPAHRPHSQIDHVLVREGIEVVSGEVLAETPSDHRPVRARLRLTPAANPGGMGTVG
jgi:endonuclease/exonuclease/phosphatase family metal-dependent hydrolase